MTFTTPLRVLAVAALTMAAPQAFAQSTSSWTIQGSQGGTVNGTRTCTPGGGAISCTREGVWVGPQGQTRTVTQDTVRTATGATGQRVVTGPAGRTRTGSWQRSWQAAPQPQIRGKCMRGR